MILDINSRYGSTMSATAALLSHQKAQVEKPKNLKRARSTWVSSFDFSDFFRVSQEINGIPSFPCIEWSFDDAEETIAEWYPASKRRCLGMIRSKSHIDLSSIAKEQQPPTLVSR
eukprot:scaffold3437_cov113-Cylindrotheca_fusiformis.AAC.37